MDAQLTFGKFKGEYVSECPSYYLMWLINNAYDPRVKQAAHDEYIHRNTWNKHWNNAKQKRFS